MAGASATAGESYSAEYLRRSAAAVAAADVEAVDAVIRVIAPLRDNGGTVWTIGNGGNAALASHLALGLSLNTHRAGRRPIRAMHLGADAAALSAAANDFGFDQAVSSQLSILGQSRDVLIALSVSGESRGVVRTASVARELGLPVCALVGDPSSSLATLADHVVSLTTTEPGVAEDVASAVVHAIYCHFMYEAAP